jgi:glycosyltransferase involved in cell wall biosynthesis
VERKPKIAILHYSVAPVIGGVESVIQAQARVFAESGYPVTILAGRGDGEAQPNGVAFIQIPFMDSLNELISEINGDLEQGIVPKRFPDITENLTRELTPILKQFDIIIVHNILSKHFNLVLTSAIMNMLNQGIIHHLIAWGHDFTWTSEHSKNKVHTGYPWDWLRTYDSRITYVTISDERQAEWAKLLGCPEDTIHVVYNGVDPQEILGLSPRISSLVKRISLWQSDLILLMPVRITEAKNIEFAIQVIQLIKLKGCRVSLLVSGPPDPHDPESMRYYQSLKNQLKALQLESEIHFIYEAGPNPKEPFVLNSEEIGELFRICDVVFMPSHREGFGMPVLEAGLVNIPLFSTPIPAAKEIGSPDVNIFPKNATPTEVVNLLMNWEGNDPIHHLKKRVRQKYTWEAIFQRSIKPLLTHIKE